MKLLTNVSRETFICCFTWNSAS